MQIKIEVAVGELYDRITILEIKLKKLSGDKLQHAQNDYDSLAESTSEITKWIIHRPSLLDKFKPLNPLIDDLRRVNLDIWEIEDDIRDCERRQDFGDKFIQLARSVYKTNDRRAAIKKEISTLFGSDNMEEKAYTDYQPEEYHGDQESTKVDGVANVKKCNDLVRAHTERNQR